ncbi:NUCB2, partial [Cordylochernes scorpioides]
ELSTLKEESDLVCVKMLRYYLAAIVLLALAGLAPAPPVVKSTEKPSSEAPTPDPNDHTTEVDDYFLQTVSIPVCSCRLCQFLSVPADNVSVPADSVNSCLFLQTVSVSADCQFLSVPADCVSSCRQCQFLFVPADCVSFCRLCLFLQTVSVSADCQFLSVPADNVSVPADNVSVPADNVSVPADCVSSCLFLQTMCLFLQTVSVSADIVSSCRLCQFLSVPADNVSVPADNVSVPADCVSSCLFLQTMCLFLQTVSTVSVSADIVSSCRLCQFLSVPADNMSVPADNMSVPADCQFLQTVSIPVCSCRLCQFLQTVSIPVCSCRLCHPSIAAETEITEISRGGLDSLHTRCLQFQGLEYGRYLQQVVQALEEDKDFAKKLENVSEDHIKVSAREISLLPRTGEVARELEFVKHSVRTKLDELKRLEIDRLRELIRKQIEQNEIAEHEIQIPKHLDVHNRDTFEIKDLKNLILSVSWSLTLTAQATKDLEELDKKRRQEFKEYEMEKEYRYRESLKNMTEEERKEVEEKHKESIEKHKEHPKVHHPGSKPQLEQVWEEQDHMPKEEFNPKTFFSLHGEFSPDSFLQPTGLSHQQNVNGDGYLDIQEVEALLGLEVKKIYNENDDPVEMKEEYNRMREHIYKEVDTNRDSLISRDEFLDMTKKAGFEQDEGWKGLDEQQVYNEDDLREYEKHRQEELRKMYETYGNQLPNHVSTFPHCFVPTVDPGGQHQTTLARFGIGHLKPLKIENNNKIYSTCPKCSLAPAAPENILTCIRCTKQDLWERLLLFITQLEEHELMEFMSSLYKEIRKSGVHPSTVDIGLCLPMYCHHLRQLLESGSIRETCPTTPMTPRLTTPLLREFPMASTHRGDLPLPSTTSSHSTHSKVACIHRCSSLECIHRAFLSNKECTRSRAVFLHNKECTHSNRECTHSKAFHSNRECTHSNKECTHSKAFHSNKECTHSKAFHSNKECILNKAFHSNRECTHNKAFHSNKECTHSKAFHSNKECTHSRAFHSKAVFLLNKAFHSNKEFRHHKVYLNNNSQGCNKEHLSSSQECKPPHLHSPRLKSPCHSPHNVERSLFPSFDLFLNTSLMKLSHSLLNSPSITSLRKSTNQTSPAITLAGITDPIPDLCRSETVPFSPETNTRTPTALEFRQPNSCPNYSIGHSKTC